MQEGQGLARQAFPILGQTATPVEPRDRALDDPSLGQKLEALGLIGPLDDLDFDGTAGATQPSLENFALVPAIGIELEKKRIEPEQCRHEHRATVTVLNVGTLDESLHQQALLVDKDVALFALDLLAGIVAGRINRAPPFSALLTLCESMMATVGLASRSARSRQAT